MMNNNSLTLLDQLATEIILNIFEYLSCNDIIYTFFHFNQRFNFILFQYQQFLNNFEISTTNLDFWENILPIIGSQTQHVIITINGFWFSLNLFPNLKSIIISSPFPIDSSRLYPILTSEQFNKLNSFKIKSQIFDEVGRYEIFEKILFKKIFHHENSLQTFQCLSKKLLCCSENIYNLTSNRNIHSLSLKLRNFTYVFSLLKYTPNLKYFNLIVTSFHLYNHLNNELDLSKIKLEKFYFKCEIDIEDYFIEEKDFLSLIYIIKQFSSSLICLSINLSEVCIYETNTFQFNGIRLQKQFLESMIHLKTFHLYAKLYQQPIEAENLLSTFWYDHNWPFGMHGKYLYTLPFHFDKLDDFIDFDHIKSNDSTIFNSPEIWYHVTSINLSRYFNFNLNIIKQIKLKMPNLISINLTSFHRQYFELTNDSYLNESLNNVTTVHCDGEFIENLKQWLIYFLPNAKYLVLSYTSQSTICLSDSERFLEKLDAYSHGEGITTDYAQSSNIKYVEIKFFVENVNDLCKHVTCLVKEISEIFKNLNIFMFHFYDIINNHPLKKLYTYWSQLIKSLNMDENLKNYQMKHIENHLQLIKLNRFYIN